MKISSFEKAEKYLFNSIPSSYSKKFPAETGIERSKSLLAKLGSPQNKLNVIHIAGTSGKGSTAVMVENILRAHGYSTGLTLSPHIIDMRERFQLGGKLITKAKFLKYLNDLLPHLEKTNEEFEDEVTYFEVLIVLAYYIFFKEKVDFAIIETGLGGTYDGTNTVDSKDKICVITRIGLDHTNILGNTLPEITSQKAGIIKQGNKVFALNQGEELNNIIKTYSQRVGAKLELVEKENIQTSLRGEHQKENATLALRAVDFALGSRFDLQKTHKALKNISFKGRFDIVRHKGKKIIIDGAHNEQKMTAFLSSLTKEFPEQKFTFLIAFKKGKSYEKMFDMLSPKAGKIIITEFFTKKKDVPKMAENALVLSKLVDKKIKTVVQKDSKKAFEEALLEDLVVVTGSLYLASEIYELIEN